MPRLLIAASGTGGHIYPALSFSDSLSNSWEIEWLGVPNRLEIELVPKKYNLIKLKSEDYKEIFLEKCLIYINYSLLLFGLFCYVKKN